ncbi:MAG: TonB-dependent receptor [Ignavibacteriales bacterium]|nr:TonB-dependent receptor [Ignavibacteriales bacterium]
MRKLLGFLFLVLVGAQALLAAGGKLTGFVRNGSNQEALVGVTVVINGTKLGALTDVNGEFLVLNIPPGVYNVTASLVGYTKVTKTDVRLRQDQTTSLNFALTEEVIQTQGIVVTAEKPKVELDLTASKESISGDDIANGWGKELKDLVSDISVANINGGIRGSFGGDVAYRMDGLDLRDAGSNTNFSSVNLSTIQDVEILTGGWNAEYGQANGSIVNIVTRKASDRLHAIASYKLRPQGQYHWGRNVYANDDVFHTLMTTRDYWDPAKTWRTPWMDPNESQKGNPVPKAFADAFGKDPSFRAAPDTAQAMADWWRKFVNDNGRFRQFDYAKRMEWEQEVTLYGPLLPTLGFLISGRYKEGAPIYPSAYKYNPDMTFQGSLEWTPSSATNVTVNGLFTKFINSGDPRTNYQSTETNVNDIASQALPYISDPYDRFKYWMYGPSTNGSSAGNAGNTTIRPPEHAQMLNLQAKMTHLFSETTFLDVALQHGQMKYNLDFRDIAQTANFSSFGLPSPSDSLYSYGYLLPAFGQYPTSLIYDNTRWGIAGDVWRSQTTTKSYSVKADLTSQILKSHLMKSGVIFSLYRINSFTHEGNNLKGQTPYIQVNDIVQIDNTPYEGAFYLQDKVEVGGMVLNAGVRLDFFNANKNVSANFYDPLMISKYTLGNPGQTGYAGYDPAGSGEGYSKTPTQYAFSPRIGISHPITETTVLHFMFGIFNQRPSWVKILANPTVWTDNRKITNYALGISLDSLYSKYGGLTPDFNVPDSLLVTYRYYGPKTGNPALQFEKVSQYEVGLQQNIAEIMSLDVTMYYKEGTNLTNLGIDAGPGMSNSTSSGSGVETRLYGEPTTFANSDNRIPGSYIGNFTSSVNGAWANVRGIEINLKSQMRWVNFDLGYTLSYLATGRYYDSKLYTVSIIDGKQIAENTFSGPNNSDNGGTGVDDAIWNPHNSALLKLSILTPPDFGPTLGGVNLFGDWSLGTSTRWAQGAVFTWYASDYTGVKMPNNQRWKDRWNTNLNLSKSIPLGNGAKMKLYVQVTNLFDDHWLRLFTGNDLDQYMTLGKLPYQPTTKEPTEWNWYTNNPRQTYFGTTIEF